MWSSGRRVLQGLFTQPVRSFSRSPVQNTVVLERWWEVPLSKVGRPPRLHPRRHRIYKLVEDTKQNPTPKMELILTQTVPKLGGRGDTVFVKKCVGRNRLLPNGLAVYPSPENKQMFAEELRILREGKLEDRIQTRTGLLTVELLKRTKLKINKMPSDEFQLTKEFVCRQFQKKMRIIVPPHALNFPFESVKDEGDYWCEVTVNGLDTVRVPISLVPYEGKQLKAQREQLQETAAISESAAEEVAAVEAVSAAAEEVAAVEAVSAAAEEVAAVEAVSAATEEVAAVEAVSAAAEEVAAVEAVSAAAEEVAAVEAVSAAAEEVAAVEAVSAATEKVAAVEAVSASAEEVAAVEAVSAAAEEVAAVEAVSAAAEEVASVEAVSAAAEEEAAVKAVSDAAVEAEAGKDSERQVSETAASAAEEETAASTQKSKDTTAPPNDSSKKD